MQMNAARPSIGLMTTFVFAAATVFALAASPLLQVAALVVA